MRTALNIFTSKPPTMKQIVFITITAFIISCNEANNTGELNKEKVKTEVSEMLHNYHKDMNNLGLLSEFKYLDSSADFFWVPPGFNSALSYDTVKAILETNAKALSKIEFHWDSLQIFPLTNEIANFSGIVKGFTMDTAGTKTNLLIIESGTVIKRKDGWKLLSGQSATLETE